MTDFFEAMAEASRAASAARRDNPPRKLNPPCRCGWRDEKPFAPAPAPVDPPTDLSLDDVAIERSDRQSTCPSCHHVVMTGAMTVHTAAKDSRGYLLRWHPQCVVGVPVPKDYR